MTLLYLITEDWYAVSHRLDLMRAAKETGYDVVLATNVQRDGDRIMREGIRLRHVPFNRRSCHWRTELATMWAIIRLYRHERPSIVHHVGVKPMLYGTIAAKLLRVPRIINAFAGLGNLFIGTSILKRMVLLAMYWLFRRCTVLVQNHHDADALLRAGLTTSVDIVPGSGIDTKAFHVRPAPTGMPIVMLAGRMLWDKGVGEFVKAAKILRLQCDARFVLVGEPDPHNPASITVKQLLEWDADGIEWWGYRSNMPDVLAMATIVVLPSYREGLPKVLLEAAACGKPIVATDVPGCKNIVQHKRTGLLIQKRSVVALACAIRTLLSGPELAANMGQHGRQDVIERFSVDAVVPRVLELYKGVQ